MAYKARKRKVKKNVPEGQAHIHVTYNNTIITKSLNLLFYVNRKQLKPDIIKFVVSHEFTDSIYKEMEINLDKITELKIQDDKKIPQEHVENDDDDNDS